MGTRFAISTNNGIDSTQWCRRKGLDAAATVVIWKMLMIAQQRIRLKNLVKA
jgi:hypothetical protein